MSDGGGHVVKSTWTARTPRRASNPRLSLLEIEISIFQPAGQSCGNRETMSPSVFKRKLLNFLALHSNLYRKLLLLFFFFFCRNYKEIKIARYNCIAFIPNFTYSNIFIIARIASIKICIPPPNSFRIVSVKNKKNQ